MKNKTSKEILQEINISIKGLTHDIKTLEGFAKELLKLRLEIDAIRSSFRKYKEFKGCEFKETNISHECPMANVIQQIKEN